MNDRRVEPDADELPMAESIVVRPELIGVSGQGDRRGNIFNVVVGGDIIDRDGGINPAQDTLIFGDRRSERQIN